MAEADGIIAAMAAILFFGSYAVPIRLPSMLASPVDPIIFQAYKAFACFLTSWLTLFFVPFKFTWWGLVGAALWCTTGIAAIMAVRLAGIGVSQSLWGGLSIFVAYIWGAYVFMEPIRNPWLSIMALCLMALGMVGIGFAASGSFGLGGARPPRRSLHPISPTKGKPKKISASKRDKEIFFEFLPFDEERALTSHVVKDEDGNLKHEKGSKFMTGVMCAVFVGISNGSFLIPLKYANKEVLGLEYLISFGVGSITVTTVVLAVYFLVQIRRGKPCPSFQFRVASVPALTTGLLWSAGNISSIYATQQLGMALGWPLVQCQLLVSTLWAVFYYKEVSGKKAASLLIGSCGLVLIGAVMLSQCGTVK